MTSTAESWRRVSDGLVERLRQVPDDAWAAPSPCEGWQARDVVEHLVGWLREWVAQRAGVDLPEGPAVADDPVGAWQVVGDGVLAVLEDPRTAGRAVETPMGSATVEQLLTLVGVSDVLVHTWDVARATGLDETLDPGEVHAALARFASMDEQMLRGSGRFGPRVQVPDDADEQTRLLALTGRRA